MTYLAVLHPCLQTRERVFGITATPLARIGTLVITIISSTILIVGIIIALIIVEIFISILRTLAPLTSEVLTILDNGLVRSQEGLFWGAALPLARITARRIVTTVSKLEFRLVHGGPLVLLLLAREEAASFLQAVFMLGSFPEIATLIAAIVMLFICACVVIVVPILVTLVQIATTLGAKTVLRIKGLVRILATARNHIVLRALIFVVAIGIVRLTMFGALEEAAIPHVLTDFLLRVKRDAIMLLTALSLLVSRASIVKMTIITPVVANPVIANPVVAMGVAIPAVIALTGLRALEVTTAEFLLTGLDFDFKRFALVLRAAPILFFFGAFLGRNERHRWGPRRHRGGDFRGCLTLVPIATQLIANFNLCLFISLRLTAASPASSLYKFDNKTRSMLVSDNPNRLQ